MVGHESGMSGFQITQSSVAGFAPSQPGKRLIATFRPDRGHTRHVPIFGSRVARGQSFGPGARMLSLKQHI